MTGRPLLALLQQVEGGSILLAGELRRPCALADALSAIARAGHEGELIVVSGTRKRRLFVRDATLVGIGAAATATAPEELLAEAVAVGDGAFVFIEGFDPAKIVARCHIPLGTRRSGSWNSITTALGIVVTAALVGVSAFLLARPPPSPPVSLVTPSVALSPSASSAPLPVVASAPIPASASASAPAPAPLSRIGTVRTGPAGGHRVWIDGKLVGETPRAFEVTCGLHVIRVGSAGQPQMTEVPCGGEVEVAFR